MRRLLIVRHGQSEWNAVRRMQGQADPPLSEDGRAQMRALAPVLEAYDIDGATSSTQQRAAESADLLGYPRARRDPRLCEQHVGEWSGRLLDELHAADPAHYEAWRAGEVAAPGGEEFAALEDRAMAAAADALARGGTQLLVAHGGVLRALVSRLAAIPPRSLVPVANASLTVLDEHPSGRFRLAVYNLCAQAPAA